MGCRGFTDCGEGEGWVKRQRGEKRGRPRVHTGQSGSCDKGSNPRAMLKLRLAEVRGHEQMNALAAAPAAWCWRSGQLTSRQAKVPHVHSTWRTYCLTVASMQDLESHESKTRVHSMLYRMFWFPLQCSCQSLLFPQSTNEPVVQNTSLLFQSGLRHHLPSFSRPASFTRRPRDANVRPPSLTMFIIYYTQGA